MASAGESAKLAVLLHADVAGSTALVQRDERIAHARIRAAFARCAQIIAAYGGAAHEIRGDALVAEFGRASDAVVAALAFQADNARRNAELADDLRPELRAGIALGEVVISDGTVTGAGIVLAQRVEQLAKPGGVCISAAIHEALPARLPLVHESLGEHALKGFDEAVRVYAIALESGGRLPPPDAARASRASGARVSRRTRLGIVALAAAALALALAGLATTMLMRPWQAAAPPGAIEATAPERFDRPSIAVLPLDNLSGNPDEEYLSDGLTQDIIDALGRQRALAVMSFGAVLPYKDRSSPPASIAQELGIRYLLEGNVRRTGKLIRVSARLTEARNGVLLWAQQFEDERADLLAVQDAITQRIVGTLVSRLTGVEQLRALAKPSENLAAYDLVLRGRAELTKASRAANREARRIFERAIELDPRSAAAHAWLGYAHYLTATDGWTEFPERALERAAELASRALSFDPELVAAHRTLGRVHAIRFQVERAIAEIERAIAINPSDAEAHGDRGVILLWESRIDDAVASLETAFSFDPNLRPDYSWVLGLGYYLQRRHADAVHVLEQAAARYPDYVFVRVALVAAYGQLGRSDQAERHAAQVRRLIPTFQPGYFGSRFRAKEHFDYLVEGMRKGGLD